MVTALVVGKNSYSTLVESNTYHDDSPNGRSWALKSEADRTRALIESTRQLETRPWAGAETGVMVVNAATVASGGSGYVVNDVLSAVPGVFGQPCRVTVTAVATGVITATQLLDTGTYDFAAGSPAATTGGTGTGATLTLSFAPQILRFTRTGLVDREGDALDSKLYPQCLKDAQFRHALAISLNTDLATQTSTGSNDKRLKAGEAEIEFFRPTTGKRFPDDVQELIAPLLGASARSVRSTGTDGASAFDCDDDFGLTRGWM